MGSASPWGERYHSIYTTVVEAICDLHQYGIYFSMNSTLTSDLHEHLRQYLLVIFKRILPRVEGAITRQGPVPGIDLEGL